MSIFKSKVILSSNHAIAALNRAFNQSHTRELRVKKSEPSELRSRLQFPAGNSEKETSTMENASQFKPNKKMPSITLLSKHMKTFSIALARKLCNKMNKQMEGSVRTLRSKSALEPVAEKEVYQERKKLFKVLRHVHLNMHSPLQTSLFSGIAHPHRATVFSIDKFFVKNIPVANGILKKNPHDSMS